MDKGMAHKQLTGDISLADDILKTFRSASLSLLPPSYTTSYYSIS